MEEVKEMRDDPSVTADAATAPFTQGGATRPLPAESLTAAEGGVKGRRNLCRGRQVTQLRRQQGNCRVPQTEADAGRGASGSDRQIRKAYTADEDAEHRNRSQELEWQLLMELRKNAGEEAWRGKMQFSHSAAVIKGLAIMIQQCASDLDVPVGNVVARLATVLLAPSVEKETDCHSGNAASQ